MFTNRDSVTSVNLAYPSHAMNIIRTRALTVRKGDQTLFLLDAHEGSACAIGNHRSS